MPSSGLAVGAPRAAAAPAARGHDCARRNEPVQERGSDDRRIELSALGLILTQATPAQPPSKARGESRAGAPARCGHRLRTGRALAAGAPARAARPRPRAARIGAGADGGRATTMRREHDFVAASQDAARFGRRPPTRATAVTLQPIEGLPALVTRRPVLVPSSSEVGPERAMTWRASARKPALERQMPFDLLLARGEESNACAPHRRLRRQCARQRGEPGRRERLLDACRRQRIDERGGVTHEQPAIAGVLRGGYVEASQPEGPARVTRRRTIA